MTLSIDTVIDRFKQRIGSQRRSQNSYEESLEFPISLLLSLAPLHNRTFRRTDFLETVAKNVICWVIPKHEYDKLDTVKKLPAGQFQAIEKAVNDFESVTFSDGLVLLRGRDKVDYVLYNPPLLTKTIREKLKDDYVYHQRPVEAYDLKEVQLDHEVTMACLLSAYSEDETLKPLNVVTKLMKAAKAKNGVDCLTLEKVDANFIPSEKKDLAENAFNFLNAVLCDINDNTDSIRSRFFKMQLCDSKFNHAKTYLENTILYKKVKNIL